MRIHVVRCSPQSFRKRLAVVTLAMRITHTIKRSRKESKRNLPSKVWSPLREASKQNTTIREPIDRQNMSDTEQAGADPAVPVQVIAVTRNLKSPPLTPGDDPIAKWQVWDDWLKEIEQEFRYFKITEPLDKKDALIIYGGKVCQTWQMAVKSWLQKVGKKLNDYFIVNKNKHPARYVFLKMRPAHGKTINVYAARLRKKAKDCWKPIAMNESLKTSVVSSQSTS